MTSEQLDALLLDRALGALAPEATALLELHLGQNPAAARRAAEFAETLQLARAAIVAPPETPAPLDLARLHREIRTGQGIARRWEFLRLAACLALGLALGWFARISHQAPIPAPTLLAVAPLPPSPHDPATHFWSVARFAPEAAYLQPQKKL